MVVVIALGAALLAAAVVLVLRPRHRVRRSPQHELLAYGFPGAMLVFDRRLRHSAALGRGVAAMGVDPFGKTLHEAFPDDVCKVFSPAYRASLDGVESQLELPVGDRDWLITVSPLGREAGLLVATDVTVRKRRERRANDLAVRDDLTGAWNARRLNEELDWLNRSDGHAALLMLDLDGFKRVNDTLGHVAGDQLLRRVATAVQSCVRRADLVARTGGDEFAVVLAGASSGRGTRRLGEDPWRGSRRLAARCARRRLHRRLGGRPRHRRRGRAGRPGDVRGQAASASAARFLGGSGGTVLVAGARWRS